MFIWIDTQNLVLLGQIVQIVHGHILSVNILPSSQPQRHHGLQHTSAGLHPTPTTQPEGHVSHNEKKVLDSPTAMFIPKGTEHHGIKDAQQTQRLATPSFIITFI